MEKKRELFSFELIGGKIMLYFLGTPMIACENWFDVERNQQMILKILRE